MGHVVQQNIAERFWERHQQEACPFCEGIGFRLVEKQGRTVARKCRCVSRERIERLWAQSGIPAVYWNQSLEKIQPQSFEEISFIDILRDYLNQHELQSLYLWIVPLENIDAREILYRFANDLIRCMGYSCLWLDCSSLEKGFENFASESIDPHPKLASEGDFLFVEDYRFGLMKRKQQKQFEEILRARIRHRKSTFFLGPAPTCLKEFQESFSDKNLGTALSRRFRVIEPGKNEPHLQNSRWLF